MGATVCTAGRFLLVAPLTKLEEEEAEAGSAAPEKNKENHATLMQGKNESRYVHF